MAFSHFVVESFACKYMFADIQGMFMPACCKVCISHPYNCAGSIDHNTLMQNESALTVFDPMTHTPRRCCHSSWLPFILKTELTQVNLASVTMEFRGSRTSLNATSAPASAPQWTCARCQIWQLRCQTPSQTHQTMNSELHLHGIVFSSIFSLVIYTPIILAMWHLSWY